VHLLVELLVEHHARVERVPMPAQAHPAASARPDRVAVRVLRSAAVLLPERRAVQVQIQRHHRVRAASWIAAVAVAVTAVVIIEVAIVVVHAVGGPRPVRHLAREREALEVAREHLVVLARRRTAARRHALRAGDAREAARRVQRHLGRRRVVRGRRVRHRLALVRLALRLLLLPVVLVQVQEVVRGATTEVVLLLVLVLLRVVVVRRWRRRRGDGEAGTELVRDAEQLVLLLLLEGTHLRLELLELGRARHGVLLALGFDMLLRIRHASAAGSCATKEDGKREGQGRERGRMRETTYDGEFLNIRTPPRGLHMS
jgi:hypothetical protein